jgi:hypothetical protein
MSEGVLGIIRVIMFIITSVGALAIILVLVFDGNINKMKEKLFFWQKKNKAPLATKETKKNSNLDSSVKTNGKVNKSEKFNIKDIEETLPFSSIEIFAPDNPIGIIEMKDKVNFVGAIEVSGINYNLLDEAERELLEKGFERLLNGIEYPIQLFVQSRKLDIENYKKKFESRISDMRKSLDKMMEKINFQEDNTSKVEGIEELKDKYRSLLSQYEYGVKIKDYIVGRCQQKNMLERKYYIIVSHNYNQAKFKEILTRQEIIANAFFDIENKSRSLINALISTKLDGELLEGKELAELLYIAYNKSDSEHYRIENAFNSKFSHLYTTSEAVEIKAMKRRLKDLEKLESEMEQEIQELDNNTEGVA